MRPFILMLSILALTASAAGQTNKQNDRIETLIKSFEQEEVNGLIKNDLATVMKHWAPDYVVNNPFGSVVDANEGPIRGRSLTYTSFERNIERVVVHGNTVIVMGNEKVVPKSPSPDAGKTINRRFTNIWMKRNGKWLVTARHASVICE